MTDPAPINLAYAGPPPADAPRQRRGRRSAWGEAAFALADAAGWTVVALILIGVPIGWLIWFDLWVLAFPAVVVAVLAVPLWAAAARAVRRRRGLAVLAYLEQVVRLNRPLDRMVAAAAAGERGRLRRRLEDLFLALQGGMGVADAVAAAVPEVSPRSLGVVAYAESTGRLAPALRQLLDEAVRRGSGTADAAVFAAWYPPVVLLVGGSVVTAVGVFVLPKFVSIFHDFHMELPPLTRDLWVVFGGDLTFLWLLPLLALGLLVGLGERVRRTLRGDRRSWLLLGWRDRVRWYAPVVGPVTRDRGLADLCDAVADAVGQGFPLQVAVTGAQRLGLNTVLLRRVSAWAGGLGAGMGAEAAARAAGLPPLVAGLSAGLAGTDDPAAPLRFAARFYADRHAARRAVLVSAYVPAVVVVLGAVTAVVGLAIFLPLGELIDHFAPNVGAM